MKVSESVLALKEEVTKHRRWFHRHPELGFDVQNTRDYILAQLSQWDFDEVRVLAGTGIKAVMRGKDPDLTLAFRADMDALSLQEETGLDFASCIAGRMHACGHDGHMAVLLGFGEWLHRHKGSLKNNVVLIFQPAEESEGGALPMIKEGVLQDPKVDAVFGFHIYPDVPQGKIGLSPGPIMAQTCEFDVELLGKSAHGAMPHRGVDALLAAAYFINTLQGIITRKIDPFEKALITIGKIRGGERRNILAERVRMEGMIRTFSDDVYQSIKENILGLLQGMELSHGIRGSFKEVVYYPVVDNNPEWTEKLARLLPKEAIHPMAPLMISEDFSYFQKEVPGVYFFLGCGNREKGHTFPLHSNRFNFDEEVLLLGIQMYVNILQSC